MNLGDIRSRILEQVDWSPDQSTSFQQKVDRLINRAYQQLSLEAPYLFFEDEIRVITQPDAVSGSNALDVLAVDSSDSYVLYRAATGGTGMTIWVTDGTWDGRMIEVTQSDGTILRRRIRETWTSGSNSYLTIDHPWPNNTDTGMSYRIYTPEYELPADVVELRSARLWADTRYDLSIETQYDMERFDRIDYNGEQTGRPYSVFRGRHHQIDPPMQEPVATLQGNPQAAAPSTSEKWLGPDSQGNFDYCYTYVWGKRDSELEAPRGIYEPKWESAPSPISDKVKVDHPNEYVRLRLPNIDHSLLFFSEYSSATDSIILPLRTKRSGLKKRIYVRRHSQIPIAGVTPVKMEAAKVFYLLAEVEGHIEEYKHQGNHIPDYYRRLKEVHGYQTIRFNPIPDSRYEVDCRVLRKPQKLVNDQDAPRIHAEAVQALIEKSLIYFYELQGTLELSQNAERRYADILQTLTKRYAMIPRHRAAKKAARVRRPYREVRVRFTE